MLTTERVKGNATQGNFNNAVRVSHQQQANICFSPEVQAQVQFAIQQALGNCATGWTPCICIRETESACIITAEVPGCRAQDINVVVHGNCVTIRGEKCCTDEERQAVTCHTEIFTGPFSRTCTLPTTECEVDCSKVKAELQNGICTITLPKTTETKNRFKQVEVTAKK